MASGYYRAGVNFQAEIVNNRDRVTGIGEIPEAAVAAHANAFIKLSAALNIDRRRVVYVIHRYSPGFLAAIHSAFETTTSVHQSKSLEEHQKADLKATMRGRVTAAVRTKVFATTPVENTFFYYLLINLYFLCQLLGSPVR